MDIRICNEFGRVLRPESEDNPNKNLLNTSLKFVTVPAGWAVHAEDHRADFLDHDNEQVHFATKKIFDD